ncbi:MAG: hypothetical protein M1814_002038 [Vezdaea aestivalis]|nr:MAG: hypothetical protein M1814_002038 [Vezdaea aestivalis]
MVADNVYELCLPVLEDQSLEEEAKIEKLEQILPSKTQLTGTALENAILDSLWRHRDQEHPSPSLTPVRHTIVRRPSPASWHLQRSTTPLASPNASSPSATTGFGLGRPALIRAKSSTASPFTSPRPSPRPTFATPQIPHSPSLQSYEFLSEESTTSEVYGDYGSENVDWLVNNASAVGSAPTSPGLSQESGYFGTLETYSQPFQSDMSPYDILRSVVGEGRSDDDIQTTLQANNYDLGATINDMMERPQDAPKPASQKENVISIGKSMSPNVLRPPTPAGSQRPPAPAVCKYWMSHGACLRADCRFTHDLSNQICKYWMVGNCLAGDTCIFSHDPSNLVSQMSIEDNQPQPTPPLDHQDFDLFPSLPGPPIENNIYGFSSNASSQTNLSAHGSLGALPFSKKNPTTLAARSRSRNRSRSRGPSSRAPAVNDADAFPLLGEARKKRSRQNLANEQSINKQSSYEGLRGTSITTAEIVKNSPSPNPKLSRKALKQNRSFTGTRENSLASQSIRPPQNIPWLETGEKANKAYLKARQDAIKHGGLRNKFLQSAAQAWNRNDARAAKALSLRGQGENDLMRKAHREAAQKLYEDRNQDGSSGGEIFVDLHGLHPEEAVEYLESALVGHKSSSQTVFAITGTGHHSKGGKDKVGKAIRSFLNEWRYAFQEFSVPGDRNSMGGILGINPASYDKELELTSRMGNKEGALLGDYQEEGFPESPIPVKVTLVREPPRGPRNRG